MFFQASKLGNVRCEHSLHSEHEVSVNSSPFQMYEVKELKRLFTLIAWSPLKGERRGAILLSSGKPLSCLTRDNYVILTSSELMRPGVAYGVV